MTPTQVAAVTVIAIAGVGVVAALLAGPLLGRRSATLGPAVVRARAFSYAALAGVLAVAILVGLPAVTFMLAGVAAVALVEWSRLTDLPRHHVVALQLGSVAIMAATAIRGSAVADLLVGGLVLAGALLPVVRPDTTRAIRDFGVATVGLILTSVMLAHGVALVAERGDAGVILVAAAALGCAGSDIGAFIVGKRFGSVPLAPSLSPAKTREGLVGNLLGAAVGIGLLAPSLLSVGGPLLIGGLIVIVAFASVWGDLLESAAKREFGVKDAGTWLPGFGGILDRVDSLLLVLPVIYWALRIADSLGT
jgi:phosphatidate cytidylyltransferase